MKQYTIDEINQKINANEEATKRVSKKKPWTSWGAWMIYLFLIYLCIKFGFRLYRLPFSLGMGVILLIVIIKWVLPAMKKLIDENATLRKRDEEREKENVELRAMLKQLNK